MDDDQIQQIFQLFYSSKGIRGTGIGLFITRKVIRQHGGRITVGSNSGQGACFVITLPRRMAAVSIL